MSLLDLFLQTLEVVEFVKTHPFINAKWTLCPGAKEQGCYSVLLLDSRY